MKSKKIIQKIMVIFIIIFISSLFDSFSQDKLSDLKPQNVSVSFNGTFLKNSLKKDNYRCNSENGVFGCNYDIAGVSDEIRQIKNFNLYENSKLLFSLENPPGSEIQISNAGFVVFMDTRNHINAELMMHFYSKSGKYLFSETFKGASLFGFSPTGNLFGVGADNGLSIISIPKHNIEVYGQAFRFAISEDENYVAIANENEIKTYYNKKLLQTIKTDLLLTRKICISSTNNMVGAIDKKNLIVFSLQEGKQIFTDKLNGYDSYRDITIYNKNILTGIHYKNNNLSKGSIKVYNLQGVAVLNEEIATKKINTVQQEATSEKVNQIQWPIMPFNQPHTVWNSYETLMASSGYTPYLHQGLDIITPIGEPVYAIEAGYVKCVLTTTASAHWRIAISPQQTSASSKGWMYVHLIQSTIQYDVGDVVPKNAYLGDIIQWHNDWGHLHFAEITDHGTQWSYSDDQWGVNFNPLLALNPIIDTNAPVIGNMYTDSKFGFLKNGTDTKQNPASLIGNVDIVVKIEDLIGNSPWTQPVYETYYWVNKLPENTTVFARTLGQKLNHSYATYMGTEYEAAAKIIFKFNSQFPAQSWFTENRNFYHILTNNNGDETIGASEGNLSFPTASYPDGNYRVYVEAKDISGNTTTASMDVTFKNNNTSDTQAPSTPTNLHATGTTSNSVSLSWNASTDNVGVTGYNVYRNSSNIGTATGTSYTVSGLSASTSYSFNVRAKDAAGNLSSNSNTVNATTKAQGTDKTVGSTQVFGSSTTIVNRRAMSYTMPEDGTIQSISLYHGGGSGQLILGLYSGSGSPGTRLGVTNTVNANASAGWQTVSLQSPASVSAGTTIWLAWNSDVPLPIYYQTGSSPRADAGVGWSSGMPNPFGTSTLANYSYSVYATYEAGGTPTTCGTPGSLSASSITNSSAYLDWSSISGRLSYDVRYRRTSTTTWTTINASTSNYTVTGLTSNTNYEFQARANCTGGSSSWSSISTFATTGTTPPPTGCSTPASFQLTNVGTTSASFSWGSIPSAVSYRVRYRKIGASTWSRKTFYSTSGTLTSLSTNTDYEAQVRSNCSSEKSAFTSSQLFTTGSTTPPPPSNKVVGNNSIYGTATTIVNRRADSFIMLENGYIQSIALYHGGGSGSLRLGVYSGSSNPGTLLGRTATVSANSSAGWQTVNLSSPVYVSSGTRIWLAWNADVTLNIYYQTGSSPRADAGVGWAAGSMPNPFGASTLANYDYSVYANYTTTALPSARNNATGVQVYPNPASDVVNIVLNGTQEANVELINLNGVAVLKTVVTNSNNSIDVSALPCGLYFVKIIANDEVITSKLIVE